MPSTILHKLDPHRANRAEKRNISLCFAPALPVGNCNPDRPTTYFVFPATRLPYQVDVYHEQSSWDLDKEKAAVVEPIYRLQAANTKLLIEFDFMPGSLECVLQYP